MFFWNSCCFDYPADAGNLIFGSSGFSKSVLNIWKFTFHILLNPDLENFEHYFTSMWDEYNSAAVWAFFGIAFLWDWNENWPFPILWQKFFQICWHIECSTLPALSFRIWNSLAAIPSFPLAFFIVMLPKTQMTSHSRISGSRWVSTASWLSALWRFFGIVLCIFATSS